MGRMLRNEAEEAAGTLTTDDRECHFTGLELTVEVVVNKGYQAKM